MKYTKFYPKSLTLRISILEMVKEDVIAAEIARRLKFSEPRVWYHIHKLEKSGYIRQVMRDRFVERELTQSGKKFLEQYQNYKTGYLVCRAENVRFKANVHGTPSNLVDWNHVQMHNWSLYTSKIDDIHVKLNLGKKPTIEFLPSATDGDGALELVVTLVQECLRVAFRLEERTGIIIGPLRLEPRGEWVAYSPVARWYSTTYGQVTVKDVGKVNASGPQKIGEFEFQDLRDLADYMLTPRRVKKIEFMMETLVRNTTYTVPFYIF